MGRVVSVDEVWSGDSASIASGSDNTGTAKVQRKFQVVVDNSTRAETSLDVLADKRIPRIGNPFPLSNWFRCEDVSASRTSPLTFDVTASYSTQTSDPEVNPLQEPAEVSFSSTSTDGEVDEDIDGNPIVTANGESISGVTMPFVDLKANVSKNIAAFNPISIYIYGNAVNSTTFMGFPAGVVRCAGISAKQNRGDELSYWTVSVEFEFRRPINTTNLKAWYKRIRHEGFKIRADNPRAGDDGQPDYLYLHAPDDSGKPATKPVMLKPDGTRETDPEIGHWLEWPVHKTENLNAMGLGV